MGVSAVSSTGTQPSKCDEEVETDGPELILPNHPGSVGEARAFTRRVLDAAAIPPDALEHATLLVSELVTNAVVHASSGVCLRVQPGRVQPGSVTRIEVEDEGAPLPVPGSPTPRGPRPVDDPTPGGLGLAIVDSLATRWGTHDVAGGKVVWFELDHSVR
jgi:anti-sigma regulatory factor (Ser/Thr protein kinase)